LRRFPLTDNEPSGSVLFCIVRARHGFLLRGFAPVSIGLDTTNRIVPSLSEASREVMLCSIDAIVSDRRPTVIKIDVEGYESEVLKGARETLKRKSLLAVETETSDSEVITALADAGFERWYYDPACRQLSKEMLEISSSYTLYLRDVACVRRRVAEAPVRRFLGEAI